MTGNPPSWFQLAFNQHSSYVMEVKSFRFFKSLTGLSSSQLNLGGSTSDSSCTAFIWSDVFDKLVKWLKKVQKGCSDKYLFLFYCVASRATGFQVEPTWLYIFSFGFKLAHVSVPTFVCNREVLNRDFSADSGIQGQFVSEGLPRASFNAVGQGRSCFFSLKLLTNNYKLNVFGSFWPVRTFKF